MGERVAEISKHLQASVGKLTTTVADAFSSLHAQHQRLDIGAHLANAAQAVQAQFVHTSEVFAETFKRLDGVVIPPGVVDAIRKVEAGLQSPNTAERRAYKILEDLLDSKSLRDLDEGYLDLVALLPAPKKKRGRPPGSTKNSDEVIDTAVRLALESGKPYIACLSFVKDGLYRHDASSPEMAATGLAAKVRKRLPQTGRAKKSAPASPAKK
jgi:hypothetical protein